MMRRAGWVLIAVVSATVACGSRSGLDRDAYRDPPSGGGSAEGGAGGGDGSGGGQGGSGGDALSGCNLVADGPFVAVAGGPEVNQSRPRLTYTNAARDEVTMALGWRPSAAPGAPSELRHVTFRGSDPVWPRLPLGPVFLADFEGGRDFALAPSGGPSGRFSLAYATGSPVADSVGLQDELTPGLGATLPVFDIGRPGSPQGLVRGPGLGLLTTTERRTQGQVFVHTLLDSDTNPTNIVDQFVLGCGRGSGGGGATTLPADVALNPGDEGAPVRVLFASAPLEVCGSPDLPPPTQLYAVDLPTEASVRLDVGVALRAVRLLEAGARDVFAIIDAAGAVTVGRLTDQAILDPTVLDERAAPEGGLDLAVFADGRIAVAYRAAGTPSVAITVLEPDGGGATTTEIRADATDPRLLPTATGDALIVALTAISPVPVDPSRVLVGRFACAP
ncbi:MAG: hypothetical protein AAGN82_15185 [Myxococcota bacterium]